MHQVYLTFKISPNIKSEENWRKSTTKRYGDICLRMLRRKYFDVSNRWYAPA